MHHIAIMKKSWGLVSKIVSGEKTIESRWYKNKSAPWGKIKTGDTVYFKNSGEQISVKAEVEKIISFSDLTPIKVKQIFDQYSEKDGIDKNKIPVFYKLFKDKKYCLLIFLKNVKKIKPFDIDKKGFGMMAAWLCVDKISKIAKR
jgi:ASC-1-like (ASCH) protein